MSDSYTQVQPNSTGDLIAERAITVSGNLVKLQCIVLGDPTTADNYAAVTAQGTQGDFALATQDLKDSGRNPVTIIYDLSTISTTEALLTATLWRGGASTSATTFSVSSGMTFRITSFSLALRPSASTATTTNWNRAALRWTTTTLATTSAPAIAVMASGAAAGGSNANISVDDGYELAAGVIYGISAIAGNTTDVADICITGFEY